MRKPSPAVRGLAIACGIFAVLVIGTVVAIKSGAIDRIPSPAGGGPVPAAETPGPDTIPPGMWTVGKDVQPGTFTVSEALPARTPGCLWSIVRTGTNGQGVVASDYLTEGGKPSVVLESGHDFESSGCGTWVRVK